MHGVIDCIGSLFARVSRTTEGNKPTISCRHLDPRAFFLFSSLPHSIALVLPFRRSIVITDHSTFSPHGFVAASEKHCGLLINAVNELPRELFTRDFFVIIIIIRNQPSIFGHGCTSACHSFSTSCTILRRVFSEIFGVSSSRLQFFDAIEHRDVRVKGKEHVRARGYSGYIEDGSRGQAGSTRAGSARLDRMYNSLLLAHGIGDDRCSQVCESH